ncbi:uncharacterized protein Z519_06825 [Cladophialophora bantiana CBS 173.52]|uniref:Ankyrin repeat protein n=1 Tax=Cladophialophora bantiana (strain ATCC 10958 / CBS 173.52 / CDC B-1940 / NIH 8579) TaxID=1442370 RepID=A0A0D2ESY6_CLAB1|nr:uncharacterized protein Z519_06825 [Cladophialophora bantiana CBS 173.52]KIW92976.1 hypothetical protein Z519_06825 [Cladophialophora bantiana CBS 173.52]
MLGMFLKCGENINRVYDLYSTALHAALAKYIFNDKGFPVEMLSLLLQRGAGLNSPGPDGNALEYLWKLANTRRHNKLGYAGRYGPLIRDLIDREAVNKRADPNGRVPSAELMLTLCTNMPLFNCGQENYTRGGVLPCEMKECGDDYRYAYDTYARLRLLRGQALQVQQGLTANAPTSQPNNTSV